MNKDNHNRGKNDVYITNGGSKSTLSRSPPTKLTLNIFCRQLQALLSPNQILVRQNTSLEIKQSHRWAPVDDSANRSTVAFTIGCYPEKSAIGRHF